MPREVRASGLGIHFFIISTLFFSGEISHELLE